jgi:hypothetical protein
LIAHPGDVLARCLDRSEWRKNRQSSSGQDYPNGEIAIRKAKKLCFQNGGFD